MTVYAVTYMMCSNAGFAVNGINNVNISSYEKRYLLSTKQSGLVASFYDIIAGIVVCTHEPNHYHCSCYIIVVVVIIIWVISGNTVPTFIIPLKVPFIGYYALTSHQPRILGVSVLCIAMGTLVMSVAHFAAPTYQPDAGTVSMCDTYCKYIQLRLIMLTTYLLPTYLSQLCVWVCD